MNKVKKEEEPSSLGFSATRLGMERAREKQNTPVTVSTGPAHDATH